MPKRRIPLFALSLAALPMGAAAQQAAPELDMTGAQIMACEAERTAEGCAKLLSRLFVCDAAPDMEGCEALLGLREAAADLAEREADLNGSPPEDGDDAALGIVSEPEDDENEVEVRAEGELVEELEDEALTEAEERLRDEDDETGTDDATGRPEADDGGNGSGEQGDGNGDSTAEVLPVDAGAADDNGASDADDVVNDGDADDTGTIGGNDTADDATGSEEGVEGNAVTGGDMTCPVLSSSDWAAWVNAMPGPDGPSLIVTGVVNLPSPGYSVALEQGVSDRSASPVQVVLLTAEAPAMDAMQVVSAYDVRFEMPSSAPTDGTTAPFTAVRVVCGDQELVRIEPIEVAQ